MSGELRRDLPNPLLYLLLAASIMAYGWGYRGTVGHEGGAMLPGALLGLVLCLGSCRVHWQRRAAVAGLFAAVGWAWGGSISYMEQTLYALSNSFPDVLYGYAMLFFLGGLWAGIGGAILGLGLTEPRSELERYARVFAAVCALFLASYLYFFFHREHFEAYVTITTRQFHAGEWFSATLAMLASGIYWLLRPRDRRAAALFFWGAAAWWVGYLALTKFGGIRLGPLHRSESWGGLLAVQLYLIYFLWKNNNRAALLLNFYGLLGGGLAFAFAVFLRHPMAVQWGPFTGPWPQWRFAEVCFGFFMALAIGLGVLRLLRGGIAPPEEDTPRAPLDVFAVFVMLIGLSWINFRRHVVPTLRQTDVPDPWLGLPGWFWYFMGGAVLTAPLLYLLYRYLKGDRQIAPASPFGKGLIIALLLLWGTAAAHLFHEPPRAPNIMGHLVMWIPAGLATALLLAFLSSAPRAATAPAPAVPASDTRWRVGRGFWLLAGLAPLFLVLIASLSVAMQEESHAMGRQRFGEDAYWRQTARMMGVWQPVGTARRPGDTPQPADTLPVRELRFDEFRNVAAITPTGEIVDMHQWFLKDQYTWLRWYGKVPQHPERAEVPLHFHEQQLYIAWPPNSPDGHLVFERTGD